MQRLFPEGRLFSYSFYGFALVNMATADPSDASFRDFVLQELERLVPIVQEQADQPPFRNRQRSMVPAGGILPSGHANLLRAGYALLGGSDPALLTAFHEHSEELFDAFSDSPVGSVATYADLVWPVDSTPALESLRLHDVLHGTHFAAAAERWEVWMADNLDEGTGMMVSFVSPSGEGRDGPRGCALSWSLAFMPGFAPALARHQFERYRSSWFVDVLGTTGVRDWPPGVDGFVDADTGPIAFGIGAAASGFGIAAAKANGDEASLTRMLGGWNSSLHRCARYAARSTCSARSFWWTRSPFGARRCGSGTGPRRTTGLGSGRNARRGVSAWQ